MRELTKDEWPVLPRWAVIYLTGKTLDQEQTKEVILRTENSLYLPLEIYDEYHEEFLIKNAAKYGWKEYFDFLRVLYDESSVVSYEAMKTLNGFGYYDLYYLQNSWKEEMGMINTNYIWNDWDAYMVDESWLTRDGLIYFVNTDIGKWPKVHEIVDDLEKLGLAFSFLDLSCSLYYDSNRTKPVCTIRLKDGVVKVCEPNPEAHEQVSRKGKYEPGIPEDWLAEYRDRCLAALRKVAPFLFERTWLRRRCDW